MKETFEEYLQREVPYWENITKEELQQIGALYREKEEKFQIWNNTFRKALASTSGVDFSTDIDKAREKCNIALSKLEKYINGLHQKYNYVKPMQDNQAPTRK